MGLNLYVYQGPLGAIKYKWRKMGDFFFMHLIIFNDDKAGVGTRFGKRHAVCFIKIRIEPQVLEANPLVFL
jgi:hypothetical protein